MLYALNFTRDKILETFYEYNKYQYDLKTKSWFTNFVPENYKRPIKLLFDLVDEKIIKIFTKGEKLNFVLANKLKEKGLKEILVLPEEIAESIHKNKYKR